MVTAFDFDYRTCQPQGVLRRYVEVVWYARGQVPYQRERIAPTGSTVAVVVLGDPIIETPDDGAGTPLRSERGFLIGPHVRPVVNEPTGETHAVGIVTTPVGCEAVFGMHPARIKAQVVDLESVWSSAARLRAELMAAGDPDAMLAVLVTALERDCQPDLRPALARCEEAVAILEDQPRVGIELVAQTLGVSHAQLDREFVRHVGISPRALARLLRLRHLLERLDTTRPIDWPSVAAEYGWFDQSHLIRDFKRHTGVTPTQYVRAVRDSFAPEGAGDAAGFVPDV